MKKFSLIAATSAFVLATAGASLAGGPVIIIDEAEPMADPGPVGSIPLFFGSLGAGGAAVAVLAVAAVAAVAAGGSSSATTTVAAE